MKIQFASGGNHLDGWLNLEESNGDMTKPLPFKNDSVAFAFVEHGTEHITHKQAWRFFEEVYRILKKGGVFRVIVPSVDKIWKYSDDSYRAFISEAATQWFAAAGLPVPRLPVSDKQCVEAIIFCHGHQACWNEEMLMTFLEAVGFDVAPCEYGKSKHADLNDIDQHWKRMSLERCKMESCVVEGTK